MYDDGFGAIDCSRCGRCGAMIPAKTWGFAPYKGRDTVLCSACYGKLERDELNAKKTGAKHTLVLISKKDGQYVQNVAKTFEFPVVEMIPARHHGYNFWFRDGKWRWWQGRLSEGDDVGDLCRCVLLADKPKELGK